MSVEYEITSTDIGQRSLAPLDTHAWAAALRQRGFVPVATSTSHHVLDDDDDDDDDDDTPQAQEPELWFAAPGGEAFAVLSSVDGALCLEQLSTLHNGAQQLTVLLNDALRQYMTWTRDWPEGGSYLRTLDEGGVDDLLAAHTAALTAACAQERSAPADHRTPDDVLRTKRNSTRLADNQGWSSSLGQFVPRDLPTSDEEIAEEVALRLEAGDPRTAEQIAAALRDPHPAERAQVLAMQRQALTRDDRLRAHLFARHDLDSLRGWPVVPTTLPCTQGRWRNWTDDEMDVFSDRLDAHDEVAQGEASLAFLTALAETLGEPAPDPTLFDALTRAQRAILQAFKEGREPGEQEFTALVDANRALPWIAASISRDEA
jgi:hypothetical protein